METLQECRVDLNWNENQNPRVSAVVFNNTIEVADHSCLKRMNNDVCSAEHLFIASVESSYMTAFFRAAKNKGIKCKSFRSTARASILLCDEKTEITDIIIRPTVTIDKGKYINRTLKIFPECKDHCLVINALKARIHIFRPSM